jgi:hypothetical protein
LQQYLKIIRFPQCSFCHTLSKNKVFIISKLHFGKAPNRGIVSILDFLQVGHTSKLKSSLVVAHQKHDSHMVKALWMK